MSDIVPNSKKTRNFLFASLALNIFLAAFAAGHICMGPPDHHHGMMPHPPKLFRPEDLFTPEEMKQDFEMLNSNFKAIQKLREDFAAKLKATALTHDEVLAHFIEIDKMMEDTKVKLREKAAKKIASLTPQERATFADKMLAEHQDEPPHDGPPH